MCCYWLLFNRSCVVNWHTVRCSMTVRLPSPTTRGFLSPLVFRSSLFGAEENLWDQGPHLGNQLINLVISIDPLHVHGNAANLGDRTICLHENRSQFPEEKLFCPPDWLHSHYVQGAYKTSVILGHLRSDTSAVGLVTFGKFTSWKQHLRSLSSVGGSSHSGTSISVICLKKRTTE